MLPIVNILQCHKMHTKRALKLIIMGLSPLEEASLECQISHGVPSVASICGVEDPTNVGVKPCKFAILAFD